MADQTSHENPTPIGNILPFPMEAKRTTDDGFIWPYARHEMKSSRSITERMKEDLATILRETGEFESIADGALVQLGWLPSQVRIYGNNASRLLREAMDTTRFPSRESACGNDPLPCDGAA